MAALGKLTVLKPYICIGEVSLNCCPFGRSGTTSSFLRRGNNGWIMLLHPHTFFDCTTRLPSATNKQNTHSAHQSTGVAHQNKGYTVVHNTSENLRNTGGLSECFPSFLQELSCEQQCLCSCNGTTIIRILCCITGAAFAVTFFCCVFSHETYWLQTSFPTRAIVANTGLSVVWFLVKLQKTMLRSVIERKANTQDENVNVNTNRSPNKMRTFSYIAAPWKRLHHWHKGSDNLCGCTCSAAGVDSKWSQQVLHSRTRSHSWTQSLPTFEANQTHFEQWKARFQEFPEKQCHEAFAVWTWKPNPYHHSKQNKWFQTQQKHAKCWRRIRPEKYLRQQVSFQPLDWKMEVSARGVAECDDSLHSFRNAESLLVRYSVCISPLKQDDPGVVIVTFSSSSLDFSNCLATHEMLPPIVFWQSAWIKINFL